MFQEERREDCLETKDEQKCCSSFLPSATFLYFVLSNEAEVPAESLPRLFERFYRVPNGDRWHQGGTGLGLSLVQKFIEHMNGTIHVDSEAGWTHFTVQLPLIYKDLPDLLL